MSLTRRALLLRLSAAGVVATLPPTVVACSPTGGDGLPVYAWDGPLGPESLFEHGVASGDPLADAVILWTRVSTDADAVEVFVEVSEHPDFSTRVVATWQEAVADRDHCLKVDVEGLSPGTTYYYRFSALGRTSPIGRTRTLPVGAVDHFRVGVCSCSNFAFGWFHTYHYLAQRRDLDLVIHLGDYLYEYGSEEYGDARPCEPPHEILTLDDYRTRYSQYRRDPDLAEVHRQNPWITVWDDHEFTNDPVWWGPGAENHDPSEGDWDERVAIGIRVYDEWMPTRLPDPRKMWRDFSIGDLARLAVVDIQYVGLFDLDEPEETRLGEEQHAWLDGVIASTTEPWFLLTQAQSFTDKIRAEGNDGSSWGLYPHSRRRVLDAVAAAGIPNFVVLTGDTHRTRAVDITEDPLGSYDPETGAGSEGVEFETGSISSIGGPDRISDLPNHFWAEGTFRTYLVLDLTPDRLQADWYGYEDFRKLVPERPEGGETWRRGFVTLAGSNHLVEADAPAPDKPSSSELAP